MRTSKWQLAALILTVAGSIYACGGSGSSAPPAPSASGQASSASSSNVALSPLTIRLTDSPFADAKSLLVTFSEVSVHRADPGEWTTIPFATGVSRTCDLKRLQGVDDLLGVGQLPLGKYTQVRLTVTKAELFFENPSSGAACAPQVARPAGRNAPVEVPSGQVKLNHEFTLTSAGSTIVLDFDGDQSIHQTGSGNSSGNGSGNGQGNGNSSTRYLMTPVIRVASVR